MISARYLFVFLAVHVRYVFGVSVEASGHTQKTAALCRSRLFLYYNCHT